jgi:hypothetical protein
MTSNPGALGPVAGRLTCIVSDVVDAGLRGGAWEESVNRDFEDTMASQVIPSARVVIDPNWLLDDLELRLTRCSPPVSPMAGQPRIGAVLPAGELLHRIAGNETRGWWNEHGLAEATGAEHSRILGSMLERSPRFLAWAAVPLVAGYLNDPLDRELLLRLVEWVTTPEPAERVVRDAVALCLVLPWLEQQSAIEVKETLVSLCRSDDSAQVRMGLLSAAAYVREQSSVDVELQRAVLDQCWSLGNRADPETAMSVGWLLKELLNRDQQHVFPELLSRVHGLCRQAMRTAVERLPRGLRVRLTAEWLEQLNSGIPRTAAMDPCSVARTRR